MEIKVHFRFNKVTGEIELFEVDDQGPMRLPEAEHNREHDRIAADVGNVVERNPRIDEVIPGSAEAATEITAEKPEIEQAAEPEAKKEKQNEKP